MQLRFLWLLRQLSTCNSAIVGVRWLYWGAIAWRSAALCVSLICPYAASAVLPEYTAHR